jgi:hypothetical protein
MEYGKLIHDAWVITWRHPFLWILGILAGGAVGLPGFNSGVGGGRGAAESQSASSQPLNPAVAAAFEQASAWAAANIALLVGLAAVLSIVFLGLIVVSFIAQGSMAEATADLATGHPISFRSAWTAGVHLFWRYVGLWLILAAAALLIAAVLAALVAMGVGLSTIGQSPTAAFAVFVTVALALIVAFDYFILAMFPATSFPRWVVVGLATLFALPLFTILITAALLASIVVAFAQRAIAVENIGPPAALRSGWRLMRAHLGDSLLAWLINVCLGFASAVGCIAGVLCAFIVLAGVGAALFAAVGLAAPTLIYIGLGSVALLVVLLTIGGLANTFFWSYWTLAYLRLSGRATSSALA